MSDPQCKTDNLFNDREIMKKFKKVEIPQVEWTMEDI